MKIFQVMTAKVCSLVLVAGMSLVTGVAHAANYAWTGAKSTEFYEAANWTPNGIPSEADTITIGAGWNVTTAQIVTLAGRQLVWQHRRSHGGTVINGPFTLTGATWASSGAVIVNGIFTLTNGAKSADARVDCKRPDNSLQCNICGQQRLYDR